MQNVVGECLIRKGYDVYFFKRSRKRKEDGTVVEGMELDFVVDLNGSLTAVEVKSGNDRRSKSLTKAMTNKQLRIGNGMKIADSNIMTDDIGLEHYPLFAPSFFDECTVPDIGPTDYIGDLSEALEKEGL